MYNYIDILRLITIILLIGRFAYWIWAERQAHNDKPKSHTTSPIELLKRISGLVIGLMIIIQLLGAQILTFPKNIYIEILGFITVIIGTTLSIKARKDLGTNWAHSAEYQIKKNHELITQGIYAYIRHPIYTGIFLSCVGAEMVSDSYLFILIVFVFSPLAYIQAKNEEKILIEQFGKEYEKYMSTSKMFIPYLW